MYLYGVKKKRQQRFFGGMRRFFNVSPSRMIAGRAIAHSQDNDGELRLEAEKECFTGAHASNRAESCPCDPGFREK